VSYFSAGVSGRQCNRYYRRKSIIVSGEANIININVSGGYRSYITKKRRGFDGLWGEGISPLKLPRFLQIHNTRLLTNAIILYHWYSKTKFHLSSRIFKDNLHLEPEQQTVPYYVRECPIRNLPVTRPDTAHKSRDKYCRGGGWLGGLHGWLQLPCRIFPIVILPSAALYCVSVISPSPP